MAKEKINVTNRAGHAMRVSAKFAQGMGLKEKPKVLPKPPELEVIKPKTEEPVKVEPTIVEPEPVEPTWEDIKRTTKRKR